LTNHGKASSFIKCILYPTWEIIATEKNGNKSQGRAPGGGNETHSHLARRRSPTRTTLEKLQKL